MIPVKHSSSADIDITVENVCARMGYRDRSPSASILSMIESQIAEAHKLLKPVYAYELREIEDITESEVTLKGPVVFTSRTVSYVLSGGEWSVLCLATIGQQFCERIANPTGDKKELESFILDAIGTEAVVQTSEKLLKAIKQLALESGFRATIRYGPGYCDWNLNQQRLLLETMDAASFGITLTESHLMVPLKSLSGVVGFGNFADNKPPPCLVVCDNRASCVCKRVNWDPEKNWLL